MKCTPAEHAAVRADPARWAVLEFLGRQLIESDGDDPGGVLEVRDCHCGNTLCVRVAG